jgi:CUE domain
MAEVFDLCDSDGDSETAFPSSAVARMPSPRTRARLNDDDDDVIEIIPKTENLNPRKRPRRLASLKSEKDADNIEVVQVEKKPPPPPTPLQQVLDIFPDVEISHAKKLLLEHKDEAENVINALIEGGTYPKEPVKKNPAASAGGAGGLFTMKSSSSDKPTYDFLSETSFVPSLQYIKESIDQLQEFFPFLTKVGATFFMKKSANHFAIAHDKIVRFLKGGEGGKAGDEDHEIRQYKKLKACTVSKNKLSVDQDQKKEFKTLFHREPKQSYFRALPRLKSAPNVNNPILLEEIRFVLHGKHYRWMEDIENEIARKENRKMSIKDGTALECACCYEQVAMDEMVQCRNEGHLFCQDCLSSYVVNQVFSNGNFGCKPGTKELATELLCFHGDGCSSGFDRYFLKKCLKDKVLERYDEMLSQVNLEKAGLRETIWYVQENSR